MTATDVRPLLRPVRLRDRRRPVPGLEAAPGRAPALLQRAVRLLRPEPLRRRRARARSTGATYSSAKGTLLELIQSDMEIPPGSIIFEDPPDHDLHRGLLSRVFTPAADGRHRAQGPRVLRPQPRPAGRHRRVRLHRRPRRPDADAHDRHAARHPRAGPGGASATAIDEGLRLEDGHHARRRRRRDAAEQAAVFAEYIDWRAEHPSDDLMTELLQAEFEDATASARRLTRDEVLGYVGLLAAAGNETTTRLIGWTGKVLAEHPDQRRELVEDREPRPQRHRGAAALRGALTGAGPLRDRRTSSTTARWCRRAAVMLLLNASANRDERQFPDGDRFDIHRQIDHHLTFGYGIHFCLGRGAGPARGAGRPRRGADSASPSGRSTGTTPCRPAPRPCGAGSKLPVLV